MEQHVSGQSNKPLPRPPHALPAEEVARLLDVDIQSGLRSDEAEKRKVELGANELLKEKNAQPLKILLRQVVNAMTLVSNPPSSPPPTSKKMPTLNTSHSSRSSPSPSPPASAFTPG